MDASELRNALRVDARILDGETRAPAGRGESVGGRASGGDVLTGTFRASKKGLVTSGPGRILRSTLNPRVKRGLCGDDGSSVYRSRKRDVGQSPSSFLLSRFWQRRCRRRCISQ